MKKDLPLLSIIIPVYGTEKFLRKCLDSIIAQTYQNWEAIIVNDCTKDNSQEILDEYAKKDKRIKLFKHEKNKGLFWARMTGIKQAKGEYISFIDSDDYISKDWFRPLIARAEKDNCDMVLGNYVEQDENGWKNYPNIPRDLPKVLKELNGEEIYKTFMSQHGDYFYWHVMWNKVYRRSFFNKCIKHYEKMKQGLIMTEDVAFSCVSLFYCNKLALEDNDCYFYCRHAAASTSSTLPTEKIIKNVQDVIFVFNFFEKFLKEKNVFEKYEADFEKFKFQYFKGWCNTLEVAKLSNNKEVVQLILDGFKQKELCHCDTYDFHATSLHTTWDSRFNDLKEKICDPSIKVVSFDVFDTLIKRPLWNPEDVFYFVQEKSRDVLLGAEENLFIKMRKNAEQRCRQMSGVANPLFEDVTLSEIYQTMGEMYGLSDSVVAKLMQNELDVEKSMLHVRESGKKLFELARFMNKKIAIVSDMYLEEKDMLDILNMNGYSDFNYFYLSSLNRKLKSTGSLFNMFISDVKKDDILPEEIIHIGDTWVNDVVKPRSVGMKAEFLPKAIDVFTGNCPTIFNGNCTDFTKSNFSNCFNTTRLVGQLPIRTMLAVVAQDIFDNPFNAFQKDSRYNGNPYFMGQIALGTYLVGICNWIYGSCKEMNYDKVLFLARDGFVAYKIFDELLKLTDDKFEAEYVYATRKSTLPYVLTDPKMFYCADNFVNIYSPTYTYRKFLKLFKDTTNELTPELENEYFKHGVVLDDQIKNIKNFNAFIELFLKLSFNQSKLMEKRKIVEQYFNSIAKGKTAAFDVGYSGRIQNALSNLCGKPVDAFFAHDNGFSTNQMAKTGKFKVFNFYEHAPLATDILREVFVSETSPSCVGYELVKGKVQPVFDDSTDVDLNQNFAIAIMQEAALKFAKQYYKHFAQYMSFMKTRNIEVGYMFEKFCFDATDFDKYVFMNCTLDDQVYSGTNKIKMVERWNGNLNEIRNGLANGIVSNNMPVTFGEINKETALYHALRGKSKFKKALYYFMFEPKLFWKKFFSKLKKKK